MHYRFQSDLFNMLYFTICILIYIAPRMCVRSYVDQERVSVLRRKRNESMNMFNSYLWVCITNNIESVPPTYHWHGSHFWVCTNVLLHFCKCTTRWQCHQSRQLLLLVAPFWTTSLRVNITCCNISAILYPFAILDLFPKLRSSVLIVSSW